jgi:hypothetical protein
VQELLLSSTDVYGASNVKQMEIYRVEPLLSTPIPFQDKMDTGKLKKYKFP